RRRAAAGEAGDAMVEAAPEEMHRARLADEAAAELLQYRIDRAQHAPEPLDRLALVGRMRRVLVERDRIGDLLRQGPDVDLKAQRVERRQGLGIKSRHRLRLE